MAMLDFDCAIAGADTNAGAVNATIATAADFRIVFEIMVIRIGFLR